MSSKTIIVFVVLIVGLTMGQSDDECGPNAVWNSCGSPCAPTCELPNRSGFCITVCQPGCFCKKGYLKDSDGTCVKKCKPRN